MQNPFKVAETKRFFNVYNDGSYSIAVKKIDGEKLIEFEITPEEVLRWSTHLK